MSSFLHRNTITFALGRVARGAAVVVIGYIYGVSEEADRIFTAYYAIGIPVAIIGFTMELSISHMKRINPVVGIPIMIIGVVALRIAGQLALHFTGDDLAFNLVIYGTVSLGAAMIYCQVAANGLFKAVPIAMIAGAGVLVTTALAATPIFGVEGMIPAFMFGELTYAAILFLFLMSGREEATPVAGLTKVMLRHLPKALVVGSAAPLLRLSGNFFGEGWVSIFTYASVLGVSAIVLITAGYRATSGWRKAQHVS